MNTQLFLLLHLRRRSRPNPFLMTISVVVQVKGINCHFLRNIDMVPPNAQVVGSHTGSRLLLVRIILVASEAVGSRRTKLDRPTTSDEVGFFTYGFPLRVCNSVHRGDNSQNAWRTRARG